jgi:hypothetical protein
VFRFSVTGTRMVRRMRATTRGRRTCAQLVMDQNMYEEERASAARSRRAAARALLERAADEPTEAHRDQWIEQARRKLQQASGPLPRRRQGLEHREDIVMRLCGRPAVLVRLSLPGHREVYHRDETCGLIGGDGRHLSTAGWIPLGEAEAVGYRPCARCGG